MFGPRHHYQPVCEHEDSDFIDDKTRRIVGDYLLLLYTFDANNHGVCRGSWSSRHGLEGQSPVREMAKFSSRKFDKQNPVLLTILLLIFSDT